MQTAAGTMRRPAQQSRRVGFRPFLFLTWLILSCGCSQPSQDESEPGEKDPDSTTPELIDAAGREYIWNIEHHVNTLKAHGLSRLATAIVEKDAAAVLSLLPPDFAGSVPAAESGPKFLSGAFSVRSDRSTKLPGDTTFNRSQFVRWLLDQIGAVDLGELKVSAHVIRLAPIEPARTEGEWAGTGKIEVASENSEGALGEFVFRFEFTTDAPSDERLAQPGWLKSLDVTQTLSGRTGAPLMREAVAEHGIPRDLFWDNWKVPQQQRLINTGGVYLNDFNKDGLHDLFVTDLHASFFFIGLPGGKFREAAQELDIRARLGGGFAAFIDIDGDGWEDLIHGIAQHPDGFRIYQNLQGQFFKDVTARSNLPSLLLGIPMEEARALMAKNEPAEVQQKPTGLSIADYDLDGMVDIYVTRGAAGSFKSGSWIDGKAGKLANNQLLRNLGDWQFEDVTEGAPLDGGQRSTSNAVWLHADDDLRPDLYVIDEFGDGILLANRADGSFEGIELNSRPTDFGSMGMTAGDIDNDGHTDIYVAEMYSKAGERVIANIPPGSYDDEVVRKLERLVDGSQLYFGAGSRKFKSAGLSAGVHAVGWAWGPCLADLNNDGWLDLYATAGFISQKRGKPDG